MAGGVLNSINKPPIFTDATDWSFKKWMDDVYTEFVKNSEPHDTITTSGQILGLDFFYGVDATSGNISATLPLAKNAKNKKYIVKKLDSSTHTVTVDAQGSDKIDGASTNVLTAQWQAILIQSDGINNWYVLAGGSGGGGGVSLDTLTVTAGENVVAGDLINIYSNAGAFYGRKAKASADGYQAFGWTDSAITSGSSITVRFLGKNTHSSGLSPGPVFLSDTAGLATSTVPSGAGHVVQKVGVADSSSSFAFEWHNPVLLAATHSISTGGSTQSITITNTTTITIPVGGAWANMIGGGGGGASTANNASGGGGGGGAGEYCQNFLIPFTVGESVTFNIGAGGAAGSAGGDTSIVCAAGTFLVKGGLGSSGTAGGKGGGTLGGAGGLGNNPSGNVGSIGSPESPVHFAGSGGGGSGNGTSSTGGRGGPAPGNLGTTGTAGNSSGGGGGSGASSIWGNGAAGGTGNANGNSAAANTGAGGGGAGGNNGTGGQTGGNGGSGLIFLIFIE